MERQEILEKLRKIFSMIVRGNTDVSLINEDADIILDLGVNSVGMMYMSIAIEKEFGIDMSDVTYNTFRTVGDVVTYIQNAQ